MPDATRAVNAGGPVAPNSVKCDTVSHLKRLAALIVVPLNHV